MSTPKVPQILRSPQRRQIRSIQKVVSNPTENRGKCRIILPCPDLFRSSSCSSSDNICQLTIDGIWQWPQVSLRRNRKMLERRISSSFVKMPKRVGDLPLQRTDRFQRFSCCCFFSFIYCERDSLGCKSGKKGAFILVSGRLLYSLQPWPVAISL